MMTSEFTQSYDGTQAGPQMRSDGFGSKTWFLVETPVGIEVLVVVTVKWLEEIQVNESPCNDCVNSHS